MFKGGSSSVGQPLQKSAEQRQARLLLTFTSVCSGNPFDSPTQTEPFKPLSECFVQVS